MKYAKDGIINSFVIDVKDDFGYIRFPYSGKIANRIKAVRPILNIDSLLKLKKIYEVKLIARIVIFKDYKLSSYKNYGILRKGGGLWKDQGGASWCDPYNEEVWEYNVDIANEILKLGFDEVQFDYVRFPTDGDIWNCIFLSTDHRSKGEVIADFLKYARKKIKGKLSIDIFGYATWRELKVEGQEVGMMSNYVDYICPMLYPSHFSSRDGSWLPKFLREFWIYYISVERAKKRIKENNNPLCQIVTYIQGFDWKANHFSPDYLYYQIKGSLLSGSNGFFVWNAKGDYRITLNALKTWKESFNKNNNSLLPSVFVNKSIKSGKFVPCNYIISETNFMNNFYKRDNKFIRFFKSLFGV